MAGQGRIEDFRVEGERLSILAIFYMLDKN